MALSCVIGSETTSTVRSAQGLLCSNSSAISLCSFSDCLRVKNSLRWVFELEHSNEVIHLVSQNSFTCWAKEGNAHQPPTASSDWYTGSTMCISPDELQRACNPLSVGAEPCPSPCYRLQRHEWRWDTVSSPSVPHSSEFVVGRSGI